MTRRIETEDFKTEETLIVDLDPSGLGLGLDLDIPSTDLVSDLDRVVSTPTISDIRQILVSVNMGSANTGSPQLFNSNMDKEMEIRREVDVSDKRLTSINMGSANTESPQLFNCKRNELSQEISIPLQHILVQGHGELQPDPMDTGQKELDTLDWISVHYNQNISQRGEINTVLEKKEKYQKHLLISERHKPYIREFKSPITNIFMQGIELLVNRFNDIDPSVQHAWVLILDSNGCDTYFNACRLPKKDGKSKREHTEVKLITLVNEELKNYANEDISEWKVFLFTLHSPCIVNQPAESCMKCIIENATKWKNDYGTTMYIGFKKCWGITQHQKIYKYIQECLHSFLNNPTEYNFFYKKEIINEAFIENEMKKVGKLPEKEKRNLTIKTCEMVGKILNKISKQPRPQAIPVDHIKTQLNKLKVQIICDMKNLNIVELYIQNWKTSYEEDSIQKPLDELISYRKEMLFKLMTEVLIQAYNEKQLIDFLGDNKQTLDCIEFGMFDPHKVITHDCNI
ncbi:uncharacterized protein LOC136717399 [Amia ocellicauda]|uniref:uncharacterized protein LOC136717399 n=1 Tax=Amia ocellicauda TaxID=2972642 RepID=UPI003463F35D